MLLYNLVHSQYIKRQQGAVVQRLRALMARQDGAASGAAYH
jgi:hypothetical protein